MNFLCFLEWMEERCERCDRLLNNSPECMDKCAHPDGDGHPAADGMGIQVGAWPVG